MPKAPKAGNPTEIRDDITSPRYLSLDCITLKGDDAKRKKDDYVSCSNCPVMKAGYCEACCIAIDKLSKILGIQKRGAYLYAKERGWKDLHPEERIDLFEMVLNDGIIMNGKCSFGNPGRFKDWVLKKLLENAYKGIESTDPNLVNWIKVDFPRYLSMDCPNLRGDDRRRRSGDPMCCKDCPINISGYCEVCCEAIEALAQKLGIRKTGSTTEVEDLGWKGLSSDLRLNLFEMVLNDGIVRNGKTVFGNPVTFRTWVFQILNIKWIHVLKAKKDLFENRAKTKSEVTDSENNSVDEVAGRHVRGRQITETPESDYEEAFKGEVYKVLNKCTENIVKIDYKCGKLMKEYFIQALKGLRTDHYENTSLYTYAESESLNQTSVCRALSDRYSLPMEKVRESIKYCNHKHSKRLLKCFREHGYGR